jgi:hypothetical protein
MYSQWLTLLEVCKAQVALPHRPSGKC